MSVAFPKIAIVGTGAIGIYYGVRLGIAGADVRFLLRADYEAVRQQGSMRVEDAKQSFVLKPVSVYETTPEIGPADLVIVGLKTTANRALAELLPPLIGKETVVLTLQNGLGAEETIAAIVGADRVMGGLAFIALNRIAPGVVKCFHHGSLLIGEFGRRPSDRTQALAAQFKAAGVVIKVADSLAQARWQKLVWNIPFNGLSIVAGGCATNVICADAELADRVRRLMKEVQLAAAAFGYRIEDEFLKGQFDVTPPMGAYRPSSLVDYLAGREVEIESIWGEPLRRAQAAHVPVPELERLYRELQAAILTERPATPRV